MSPHGRRLTAARAIAFYSGFAIMAFEVILGRVLTPYFGGSVYTWGAVISVFLIGMTAGFFIGGVLADRLHSTRWAGVVAGAAGLLLIATPPLVEPVGIGLLDTGLNERWGAALGALAFGALPAALFAILSPYAVKLALNDIAKTGSVAGQLSALNAFGSISGTLLTTFVFIPNVGSQAIIFGVGASAVALGALILATGRLLAPAAIAAAAVAFVTLPYGAPAQADETTRAAHRIGDILEKAESLYNNIFIVKQGEVVHMTFGYQSRQYVESAYDPRRPDELVVGYTRYMPLGLLYNDKLDKAALIGLGGGRTASYLTHTFPLAVSVAEIDGEVDRLAKTYFDFQESEQLSVDIRDGRIFLYRTHDDYDYIFLDAYRGPFVPFHLTTREFYRLCKRRLNDGGVVIQNVDSSTLLLDSTYATLDDVFDHVDAYMAGRPRGNIVLIAYDGEEKTRADLEARAAELNAQYAPLYDLSEYLDDKFEIDVDVTARILTDDFAPAELLNSADRHNEKWE